MNLQARSLQDAYTQLYDPENYTGLFLEDIPHADHFLNPDGTFKPGRDPQVTLHPVRTLMDTSETTARQFLYWGHTREQPMNYSGQSVYLPDHAEVLAIRREFSDYYVGGVHIPELGYVGDVWVPGSSLPYDDSGNAGGVVFRFNPYPEVRQSVPWQAPHNPTYYWAVLDNNQRLVVITHQTSDQLTLHDPLDNRTFVLSKVGDQSTTSPFRYQYNGSAYEER